ncbi:MAG: cupin domain-containing protein [Thermodesulfobacteriota bacterium]
MGFWRAVDGLELGEFRPGVQSRAEIGQGLVMACLEIAPGREDAGHQHPFEQCGLVVAGRIEMTIGAERRVLEAQDAYFIPAGVTHGWKTFDQPARILDVCAKPA